MTYPIVLANGPPTADLKTVTEAGATMIRPGRADWNEPSIEAQLAAERATLDAAHAAGLRCWVWLGTAAQSPSCASWRTRRSSTARAGSSSSAATQPT